MTQIDHLEAMLMSRVLIHVWRIQKRLSRVDIDRRNVLNYVGAFYNRIICLSTWIHLYNRDKVKINNRRSLSIPKALNHRGLDRWTILSMKYTMKMMISWRLECYSMFFMIVYAWVYIIFLPNYCNIHWLISLYKAYAALPMVLCFK